MLRLIRSDLRRKALWCYESDRWTAILKVLLTDGTAAIGTSSNCTRTEHQNRIKRSFLALPSRPPGK